MVLNLRPSVEFIVMPDDAVPVVRFDGAGPLPKPGPVLSLDQASDRITAESGPFSFALMRHADNRYTFDVRMSDDLSAAASWSQFHLRKDDVDALTHLLRLAAVLRPKGGRADPVTRSMAPDLSLLAQAGVALASLIGQAATVMRQRGLSGTHGTDLWKIEQAAREHAATCGLFLVD